MYTSMNYTYALFEVTMVGERVVFALSVLVFLLSGMSNLVSLKLGNETHLFTQVHVRYSITWEPVLNDELAGTRARGCSYYV